MQRAPYRIPVYAKGEITAWAAVDSVDHLWASQYRWHLCEGYPARAQRKGGKKNPSVRIFMHREILGLKHGYRGLVVDHLNGEKLDNRRENLRAGTHAENHQNRRSNRGSTSQYPGVHWNRNVKAWRAAIMVNGRWTLIGDFADEHDAGRAAAAFRAVHTPHSRFAAR